VVRISRNGLWSTAFFDLEQGPFRPNGSRSGWAGHLSSKTVRAAAAISSPKPPFAVAGTSGPGLRHGTGPGR
jgi:hypothetical protein